MKKIIILLIPLLIYGCNINIENKKDLLKEISYTENGLSSDDVYTLINGVKEKRNEFVFGEEIELIFDDVKGFVKDKGAAFPEMEMVILSEDEKDTLNYEKNILSEYEDGITEKSVQLKATILNTLPVDNYVIILKAYDLKGEGFFNFLMPFKVIKNDRISVVEYGLKANYIYLYDEVNEKVITDNIIDVNTKVNLIINGLQGLDKSDSLIYPIFKLDVTDVDGNVLYSEENLFKEYYYIGINRVDVEEQFFAYLNFTPGKWNNPYKLKASFIDEKSGKKLDILTFINIRN